MAYRFIKLLCGKEEALAKLAMGDVLCIQTGRLYGLLADATNGNALDKVYAIKCRERRDKMLPIFFHSIKHAKNYVKFSDAAKHLAECLWPGDALTIVLPQKKQFIKQIANNIQTTSDIYEFFCDTDAFDSGVIPPPLAPQFFDVVKDIAVRVPSDDDVLWLIKNLGHPVCGTSANVSGYPVIRHYKQLEEQLCCAMRSKRTSYDVDDINVWVMCDDRHECILKSSQYGTQSRVCKLLNDVTEERGRCCKGGGPVERQDTMPSTIIAFNQSIYDGIQNVDVCTTGGRKSVWIRSLIVHREGAMTRKQVEEVLLLGKRDREE